MGLPRKDIKYGRRSKGWLYGAAALMSVVAISGAFNVLDVEIVRGLNLSALFLGAGLRLLAHGQASGPWKTVDLLGKEIAYYGALVVMLTYL